MIRLDELYNPPPLGYNGNMIKYSQHCAMVAYQNRFSGL
jgi:hypothetical protein